MKFPPQTTVRLSAIALAITLTACGGGSGSGDVAGAPGAVDAIVTPDPAPVLNTALVTSVPAATYIAGSEEAAAFNLLNAERDRCGFGLLKQNAALDTSARGHADWLLINGYTGHFQTPGTPGFTGVTPDDRMVAAGYGAVGSFVSNAESGQGGFLPETGMGTTATRMLLNAPYHALTMVRSHRDGGVAVRDKFDVGLSPNNSFELFFNFGYKNSEGPQLAAAGSVRTYPCPGSTGVRTALYGESPSPAPDRNLRTNPIGSSVMVVGDPGTTLVITSASMTIANTGASVLLRVPQTKANDANISRTNEGFVSADGPLAANTAYQVNIDGTSNGVAFNRNFVFTTGN